MKKFLDLSSWSVAIGSMLIMAFAFVGCDDSSSASAENSEPAALSSAEKQGSSSSSRHCEECNDEAISSDSNAESNGSSSSSSSEKLSEASSSSADKVASSSSSVALATPCKTETEDNCEYGTVLDDRDGQTYKTVKIGDQWWMAENLNYKTDNSFCYKDKSANCTKYGRHYAWAAAMDSVGTWSTNGKGCGYRMTCSPTYPVRGVCPEGWHLPDTTEWNTLFTAVGGSSVAGTKLKSTSGWYDNGNGTDAFSFSALPAGGSNDWGDFNFERMNADFWSSTEGSHIRAYFADLYCMHGIARLRNDAKSYVFPVRCVKD